jgi:hypothetical protein
MESQTKSSLEALIDNVPTDVSGKWVKKEELYSFAAAVANHVLSKVENKLKNSNV